MQDIFIACVDGLKSFLEAIETVYPQAIVQLCIVHMARNSLNYVGWNKRKEVAADLRLVYSAATILRKECLGTINDLYIKSRTPALKLARN